MRRHPLFALAAMCATALVMSSCSSDDNNVGNYLSQADALYTTLPDLDKCQPGTLTDATKQTVIDTLNEIRALHGLSAVGYDKGSDADVSQGALMLAANGQLNHFPPSTWTCYTSTGASGLGTSNLTGGMPSKDLEYLSPEGDLTGWLTDVDNLTAYNIGHRRWVLDPFLQNVAYGRADATNDSGEIAFGSALKVIKEDGGSAAASSEVIAYPFNSYPSKYYQAGALFSLSILHDKSSISDNADVDFSAAVIAMQERGGAAISMSHVAFDNDGYGLPNNLQFLPAQVTIGKTYDITVSNVVFGGEAHSYSYWVEIVQ